MSSVNLASLWGECGDNPFWVKCNIDSKGPWWHLALLIDKETIAFPLQKFEQSVTPYLDCPAIKIPNPVIAECDAAILGAELNLAKATAKTALGRRFGWKWQEENDQ